MQPVQLLEQATIWLSVARSVSRGRACRDYAVYDDAGVAQLVAQTSPWDPEIVVHTVSEPQQPFLLLRRRESFPLTGRVDVWGEDEARLGVVSRGGRYRAVDGRAAGRFRDARTFGEHARENALTGVLDALLGVDEAEGNPPSGFVWLVGDEVKGRLTRARLPFGREPVAVSNRFGARPTSRSGSWSKRLRELGGPAPPHGWRFTRVLPAPSGDPRLVLAAALFAIELSHW